MVLRQRWRRLGRVFRYLFVIRIALSVIALVLVGLILILRLLLILILRLLLILILRLLLGLVLGLLLLILRLLLLRRLGGIILPRGGRGRVSRGGRSALGGYAVVDRSSSASGIARRKISIRNCIDCRGVVFVAASRQHDQE